MGVHQVFEVECDSCHRTRTGLFGDTVECVIRDAEETGWQVAREPLKLAVVTCDRCRASDEEPIPFLPTSQAVSR